MNELTIEVKLPPINVPEYVPMLFSRRLPEPVTFHCFADTLNNPWLSLATRLFIRHLFQSPECKRVIVCPRPTLLDTTIDAKPKKGSRFRRRHHG